MNIWNHESIWFDVNLSASDDDFFIYIQVQISLKNSKVLTFMFILLKLLLLKQTKYPAICWLNLNNFGLILHLLIPKNYIHIIYTPSSEWLQLLMLAGCYISHQCFICLFCINCSIPGLTKNSASCVYNIIDFRLHNRLDHFLVSNDRLEMTEPCAPFATCDDQTCAPSVTWINQTPSPLDDQTPCSTAPSSIGDDIPHASIQTHPIRDCYIRKTALIMAAS